MQSRVKAGLIVGGVQLVLCVLGMVSGIALCCPVFLPVLSLFAGAVAGWLAVEWSRHKPEQPWLDGFVAGGIASLGQLLGLVLLLGGYLLLVQLPGFEDAIIIHPDAANAGYAQLFVVLVIVAILVLVYLTFTGPGLGVVAAYYRANVKPFAASADSQFQQDEDDVGASQWDDGL